MRGIGRRSTPAALVVLVLAFTLPLPAQTRRTTRKPAPKPAPAAPVKVRPEIVCPAVLGVGVHSRREFCNVQVGRDPQAGIVIRFPAHRGPVVLGFNLHNLETYSEQLVREGRAYTKHTATIGVLGMDGTLITRAVVETEFRSESDLFDRIGGGAGPAGVKAVAPAGDEEITVEIPENFEAVSVLGEKLKTVSADGGETMLAPAGRPIAVISNVTIEYRPAPAPRKKSPAKPPIKKLSGQAQPR